MNKMFQLTTPVVFIIFNRLEPSKRVFDRIRKHKPTKLYIVSDGPRKNKPEEEEKVRTLREQIEDGIDWNCETVRIYAPTNLGCDRRITTALDEVFEREESAIILEDDCLPNDSFFEFCQTMLREYKDDERVLSINGDNKISYDIEEYSLFFSKVFVCWGWATWRRAWKGFDREMLGFSMEKNNPIFRRTLFDRCAYWNMMAQFETSANPHNVTIWDYAFYYDSILRDGYHIHPKYSLIMNIGFGKDSTHTSKELKGYHPDTCELEFPLCKPDNIIWERGYDAKYFQLTQRHGWIVRIKQFLGIDINTSIFDHVKNNRE